MRRIPLCVTATLRALMRSPMPRRRSHPCAATICLLLALAASSPRQTALADSPTRSELAFPDLPGLVTVRCDFHMHTVFSDGGVWPSVRVEEAWRDGLDAIALTDHIEYVPHKADLPPNYGRSFEIARAAARPFNLITIRSAEITRGEPPGHLNTLFLTNVANLEQKEYRAAISNAFFQGAFIFWNHPGWKQPGGKAVWYEEQGEFLQRGWLHGIEIVNGTDYDPIAHQWCVDKGLTILGNSDVHGPIAFEYGDQAGRLRPLTLVFAADGSASAIRDALFGHRTAVFSQDQLFGAAQFLDPLFHGSIEVLNKEIRIRGKGTALVQIRNKAPINYRLRLNPKLPELDVPSSATLTAGKVSLIQVRCLSDRVVGEQELALPCAVTNLVVAPGKPLKTALRLRVTFEPDK